MTQLDRRIQKLEAVADTDTVRLLFITWVVPEEEPPCRMAAEWNGERLSQNRGESEASFLDRVRDEVDRNRPSANNVAAVFLSSLAFAHKAPSPHRVHAS